MTRLTVITLLAGLTLPLAARADRLEKQVPVTAGRQLEIDLEAPGSITIKGTGGNTASVTVEREGRDATDTEIAVESTSDGGARLTTGFASSATKYTSHLRITVLLPRRFNVQLLSMGGAVHLEGLDGKFEGRTMGGELVLEELNGAVDLKTMAGDILVSRSKLAGSLTSLGGNVQFDNVEGSVHGKTSRGKLIGKASGGIHPVEIFSVGDLRLGDAPYGADLKTMHGNVLVHAAAKYVKAFTMGGNIVIDRIDGKVEARTLSGDINVTLVNGPTPGSRGAKLESQSGAVHLEVPAGLAMDIDIKLSQTPDSGHDYRVYSDFPLKTEEKSEAGTLLSSPRRVIHATGRQGDATHRIELRAFNGDVYLTRSPLALKPPS